MKERESNKKHMFRRIACLFVALMVMGILGNGYVAPAEAKQKKQKAEETEYKVMEEEDLLYLVDEEGEYQSGWFFKLGGRYIPFKKVKNLGLYKPNKIRILYADSEGMLAQDEEKGDFSFDEKGFLSDATGLCQIKEKYYLFKNGKICPSDCTCKKARYYMHLDGSVYAYREKNKTYTPSGKKMNSMQARDVECRTYANMILRKIIKKSMTQPEALQKCFQYIVHHYNYKDLVCDGKKGWTSKLGIDILRWQNGDCRGISLGFVYLATELGYKKSYLCQDSVNRYMNSHCWAMINGKCYDPLFFNSKRPSRYMAVFNGSTPAQYRKKVHCYAKQKFKAGD